MNAVSKAYQDNSEMHENLFLNPARYFICIVLDKYVWFLIDDKMHMQIVLQSLLSPWFYCLQFPFMQIFGNIGIFISPLPLSSKLRREHNFLCSPQPFILTSMWAELLFPFLSFMTFKNKGFTQTHETICILFKITVHRQDNFTIIENKLRLF